MTYYLTADQYMRALSLIGALWDVVRAVPFGGDNAVTSANLATAAVRNHWQVMTDGADIGGGRVLN